MCLYTFDRFGSGKFTVEPGERPAGLESVVAAVEQRRQDTNSKLQQLEFDRKK